LDWDIIITLLFWVLAFFILPFVFRRRRKGSERKMEELYEHLQSLGIKAHMEEEYGVQETKRKWSWGQKKEGTIRLRDRNIDSIEIGGASGQYGTSYFLDYLTVNPGFIGMGKKKKTRMVKKKASRILGKVAGIEWKGDEALSRKLNFDYRLNDRLLQGETKSTIEIIPDPKNGYTRIRTPYILPEPYLFEVIDTIAGHIKSP
jgi:hypothetical protein